MTLEKMTVAEGLNEIKRVDNLLQKRVSNISLYSSKMRKEKDAIPGQQKYIDEQKQSAEDLLKRFVEVKTAIQRSNLETKIRYIPESGNPIEMTVAEALTFKQESGTYEMERKLYQAFSGRTGQNQIQNYLRARQGANQMEEEDLEKLDWVVYHFFDQKEVMQKLEDLDEFKIKLDVLIEASNHQAHIGE